MKHIMDHGPTLNPHSLHTPGIRPGPAGGREDSAPSNHGEMDFPVILPRILLQLDCQGPSGTHACDT